MPYIDFKAVRAMVTMEELLIRYGLRFIPKPQLHNLLCPLPTHTSHDKNSLNVNLERNIWSCKSQTCIAGRNGKEGGNTLDFVMLMEGCSAYQAAEKILEWYGPKVQKPPLGTEALAETQNNLESEDSSEKPRLQVVSRIAHNRRKPIWAEKIPAEPEKRSSGGTGRQPVPPDHSAGGEPVNSGKKGKSGKYMQEVDEWFDELTTRKEGESEEKFWHRVRNGVKERLIQSYNNGKVARSA